MNARMYTRNHPFNHTRPVVDEQVMHVGRTVTIIAQYDLGLFEGEFCESGIAIAADRFESLLRREVTTL